ncbi:hypothetical protein Verru16b_02424 [Lacunisphaera limnophila]|uniref:ABC-2 family transporter protein n=1 Tax=Lacunisphaera limnophila TaxID=1838286 RepID=A0A1D8AWW1_9BACT|nr:hypothetical protein [Lacunisphaera limnophila]AOS45343.1 hypothetical protein Verru16b_02424 [Lacunisphaera limnophila]
MNLMLHVIRKDLVLFRWTLLIWVLGLGYLFLHSINLAGPRGDVRDFLQLTAMLLMLVSSFAYIAGIIQADHPTAPDVHWRTLPLSAPRLLGGKLIQLGLIFILVPVLALWLRRLAGGTALAEQLQEYGLLALIFAVLTLTVAAAAACTKNVVHCLGLWLGLVFLGGTLTEFLDRFAPVLSRQALAQLGMTKIILILGFSLVVAVAVLLNQYLRRRVGLSLALLVLGAVGSTLIGTFWGYFYFYSSQ